MQAIVYQHLRDQYQGIEMLLTQLDSPKSKPPVAATRFVTSRRQPVARAEVRITLRGRSESPPLRRANFGETGAFMHVGKGNVTAAITLRRHSVATASQYAPISEDQLEDAEQTIGLKARDSAALTTYVRDLETVAAEQLPPIHPRSVLPRATDGSGNVNQTQVQNNRSTSGTFSSTFLINTPGHACVTRSKSFKTLRRCESTGSSKFSSPTNSGSLLARHASFETALAAYSERSDFSIHIPPSVPSEDPPPRLRSVASIGNFTTSNPNAKLPPAHPAAILRNGAAGMIASNGSSNSPGTHQHSTQSVQLQNSSSSPSVEPSTLNLNMTGGGLESTVSSNQGPPFLPKEVIPNKRTGTRSAVGRHYSRIQLPSTKASSRSNTRVMTDSLKLYEEQIFSHQISSGQRPLSWCIDMGCLDKTSSQTPDDNSSDSPSATNSSSTMSSACSSSSSSNASHAVGPPRVGHLNRLACLRPGTALDRFGPPSTPQGRNLSPIIHAAPPGSPLRLHSPPVPPGAPNRVHTRGRPAGVLRGADGFSASTNAKSGTSEDSTPNAGGENKGRRGASVTDTGKSSDCTSTASTFASSLSTVRPSQSTVPSPSPPPPSAGDEDSTTLATVRPDDSFPPPSLSLLPPPPPWDNRSSIVDSGASGSGDRGSAVRQIFVCPYCRALPTLCRCSASLTSAISTEGGENSPSFESDSEDEEESTYAFSTLDSDFIAWMRLSVKDVTASHPSYNSRQTETLAALTRQEVMNIVNIFNTNSLGLRMNMEGTSKLVGTIRVYINLIKPVKMSLRRTMRQIPPKATESSVPDRLISFFLPRGGSRLLQLSGSTSAQEVIQCLLDRFHIQESASKFALYEHTLEKQTILSRKLTSSERPLSMVMHWVRAALALGEDFALAVRRKRIVLQENENWEVNWSDFTPAELMNFLRILEKEEAEYRNAIYFQYGLVRQQIEQRMAQLSAQDRLLAARHSVASCPPPEHLLCTPVSHQLLTAAPAPKHHHASL